MTILPIVILLAGIGPSGTPRAANTSTLPPDLTLVPSDTCALASIRPADMLAGEFGKRVRELDQGGSSLPLSEWLDGVADWGTVGIPLTEIERFTVFGSSAPLYLVTAKRPLDRAMVLRKLGNKAAATKVGGMTLHKNGDTSVLFPDDRSYLTGPGAELEKCAGKKPKGQLEGLMAEALREIADKRHLVAAIGGPAFKGGQPEMPPELVPGLPAARPLLRAESALLACSFGKELQLDLRATYADEALAKQAEQGLRAVRDLAVANLPELGEVLAESSAPIGGPQLAKEILRFYEALEPALKTMPMERKGKSLRATLKTSGRYAEFAVLVVCMPRAIAVYSDDPQYLPLGTMGGPGTNNPADLLQKGIGDSLTPVPLDPAMKPSLPPPTLTQQQKKELLQRGIEDPLVIEQRKAMEKKAPPEKK